MHSYCRKKYLKKKTCGINIKKKTSLSEIQGFAELPLINILNLQLGLKYSYNGPLSS